MVADSDRAELIDRTAAEEATLVFARFDADTAWRLGNRLRDVAIERGHAIAIDISVGEQLLFFTALPGTVAHNRKWIERKKATVREWSASSYLVGLRFPVVDPPFTLEQAPWMDVARYSGSGGGFPIVIDGVGCVGTIAVSGLRHDLDHALIVDVVTDFLRDEAAR